MGFKHRKLMSNSINETSTYDCNICNQFCLSSCADFCPGSCIPDSPPYIYQYPPPSPISDSTPHKNPTNKFLIVTLTIIAAAFLVLCCLVYYIKCFTPRSISRRRSSRTETRDEFLDEDHGPIVDHPIWYINTVGLQPSIIHSISVCKYKKGEGLVEGTDCSVCLNEFQEDETLRLLPKCSHAFHIPCIDTWLRSHTTCPMCRAPIVSNAGNRGQQSSSEVNNEVSGGTEEQTQVVIMEDDHHEEAERRGTDGGISEVRDEEDELGVVNLGTEDEILQPMRRSVSLDSMAACQISKDLVSGDSEGSNRNSDNDLCKGREASLTIVPRRRAGTGNQSLLRFMCQTSIGRSFQSNPIFMRRSVSFSGSLSLPRSNNKSHITNPPPRSF